MDIINKIHILSILLIWGVFKLYSNFNILEKFTEKQNKIQDKTTEKQKINKLEFTVLSNEQSEIDSHYSGYINPKIYNKNKNNKKINGINLETYNIIKNPVEHINHDGPLPKVKHRKRNWKQQRIWQQTFI